MMITSTIKAILREKHNGTSLQNLPGRDSATGNRACNSIGLFRYQFRGRMSAAGFWGSSRQRSMGTNRLTTRNLQSWAVQQQSHLPDELTAHALYAAVLINDIKVMGPHR
jgi:hypothetical protein